MLGFEVGEDGQVASRIIFPLVVSQAVYLYIKIKRRLPISFDCSFLNIRTKDKTCFDTLLAHVSGTAIVRNCLLAILDARAASLNQFAGNVALVTGASHDIDRATALDLTRNGTQVVINYPSDENAANELVAHIASDRWSRLMPATLSILSGWSTDS